MKFVVANFKMNKTEEECKRWATEFQMLLYKGEKVNTKIGVAPPFFYVKKMYEMFLGTGILVGVQDVFWENEGPFTGEISPKQAKDVGAIFAIIGHSERRRIFGENEETSLKKLIATIKEGLIPILCVGETEEERKNGKTLDVIEKQISILEKIERKERDIFIAYEPVWAIGTGNPAKKDEIKEVVDFIKSKVKVKVLYGGSINEKICEEIRDIVDGALVGSASLQPEKFYKIVKTLQ